MTSGTGASVSYEMLRPGDAWIDQENDAAVAACMAMSLQGLAGQSLLKADYLRTLIAKLPVRSIKAIDYKFQNVSHVLDQMELRRMSGYTPAIEVREH